MKYKITKEKKNIGGRILHRIECVEPFADVKAGEKGGWIEKESNLSQRGNAWVFGDASIFGDAEVSGNAWVFDKACVYGNAEVYNNACVYGNAEVYDNARVCGNACVYGKVIVYGNACVYGNAEVYGDAKVYGNAKVSDSAEVYGDAKVSGNADYILFKNNWSSGRYFTYTRSNKMWKVGCFYGTGEELIKKAYADSESSGKHYEAYVRFVEQLEKLDKEHYEM